MLKFPGILIIILAVAGCSTLRPANRFEMDSSPTGAEVTALSGEKLGSTPLVFSEEQLSKARVASGRIGLRLTFRGHVDREVILETHGEDSYLVKLAPVSEEALGQKLLVDYAKLTNAMIRDLLQIQGLLITRKFQEAEKSLEELQKRYPGLAALYVMRGNLELIKGNKPAARGFFLRAVSLDPDDPVAARLARQTEGAS